MHQRQQPHHWDNQHTAYGALNLTTSALNPEDKGLAPACGAELTPEGIKSPNHFHVGFCIVDGVFTTPQHSREITMPTVFCI